MKAEVVSHEENEVLLKSLLANSHRGRDSWSVTGVDDDDVNNDMVEECAISIFRPGSDRTSTVRIAIF